MEKSMELKFKGFVYNDPVEYKNCIKWKCTEKSTKNCPSILKTNLNNTNQRRLKRHNHLMLYPYGKYDWIYLYVKCVLFMYKIQFLLCLYFTKTKKPFFRYLFIYVIF